MRGKGPDTLHTYIDPENKYPIKLTINICTNYNKNDLFQTDDTC